MNHRTTSTNRFMLRRGALAAGLLLGSAVMLGGCGSDAQGGALLGAGLGAGLGAIIGHQSGHAGEGAGLGAAAGAVTGYMIGNESDKQRYHSTGRYHSY